MTVSCDLVWQEPGLKRRLSTHGPAYIHVNSLTIYALQSELYDVDHVFILRCECAVKNEDLQSVWVARCYSVISLADQLMAANFHFPETFCQTPRYLPATNILSPDISVTI